MKENIDKIKEAELFYNIQPHPTPNHPLIKNNEKMKGVWVADVLAFNYRQAKSFLSDNKIKHAAFNKKKSFFIWP